MEGMTVLLSALAGLCASGLPILTKFIIDFFAVKRKASLDERQDVWNEATKLRQDLQSQLLDLRATVVGLQEANMKYILENAEQKGKIRSLEVEIVGLKSDLVARDADVAQLQAERTTLTKLREDLEQNTVRQLAALGEEIIKLKARDAANS